MNDNVPIECALLSRVIQDKDFHSLEKAQITEQFFSTPEGIEVYKFLREVYHNSATSGQVPSMEFVRFRFPGFYPFNPADTVPILAHQLRLDKVRMELLALSQTLADQADRNPMAAMASLRAESSKIASLAEAGQDLSMASAHNMLLEQYEMVQDSAGLLGIPYPWDQLNEETQGMQPGQFIILFGRPKCMKCVCEGQRIMMWDGSLLPIERVPEITSVPSYTNSVGQVRMALAKRVVSGTKNCVEVETESGLRLRTSDEHLYMTPGGGYTRIGNLKPGDYIATARRLPDWEPVMDGLTPKNAHLLGLLVGDGNYTRNEVQFTSQDVEIVDALKDAVSAFNCTVNQGFKDIEFRVVGNEHGSNGILNWLRDIGIHGQKSTVKRVPEKLFSSSKESIASFLAGLLDTDGHVGSKFTFWSSASRGLLEDVQHLLMRFGIRGRLTEVTTNYGTLAYNLFVYSKEQNSILNDEIGKFIVLGYKRDALKRLATSETKEKRNVDAIPYTDALYSTILQAKGEKEWPSWGTSKFDASKLFRRSNRISRKILLWLAKAFNSQELEKIANNEIVWEQIESITPIGQVACYDICVTDGQDPNFVVEGFIVHNTWLAIEMACHAYLHARRRVLFYTREMSPRLLAQRIAARLAKVDYKAYKNGRLQPELKARAFAILKDLMDDEKSAGEAGIHQPYIRIVSDRGASGSGGGGVGWLEAKIREYKPDLVVVDGMYLMKDDRSGQRTVDWKAIAHISQDLKLAAQEHDIPIIGVTQANRAADKSKGEDLTELAYADSFGQDADAVFRVSKMDRVDENTKIKRTELYLTAPGLREGKFEGIVIHGAPANDFSYLRTIVEEGSEGSYEEKKQGSYAPKKTIDPRIKPTLMRK